MNLALVPLDKKQTLSIPRLQYIYVLSDEAAKAFTTTYIKYKNLEAKVTDNTFSFANKSVVEKVFGAVIVTELFRAYSYDLQQTSADKKLTNIMYYDEIMKDRLLTNRTVDHVWDYMHPELKDEKGDHVVQEMVVMDKLAFFYTQYIVQFALIGVCRMCLPFIDKLGNRSKVKDLLPQHCALNTTKQIVLNPRDWSKGKKASNDQPTRDEYLKMLGLQFNGAIIGNSVPRTFKDCMEAILYQKKKEKKKCSDSKWWDFFDLENFATLFDKPAGEAISDRKAEFMVSDEEDEEDLVDESRGTFEAKASDASPKFQLHNNLLATFQGSNPAEKMFLFQNAMINLFSATDDDSTKGTENVNEAQAQIFQNVTTLKGPSLSSITAQIKRGISSPIGTEEIDTEQNPPKNDSYSSDEESISKENTMETSQSPIEKDDTGDSANDNSDKRESEAATENADKTSLRSTENDDTEDTAKDNSDKSESEIATKNANETCEGPTEKNDDTTQHGGKANSSELDNTNVDSGLNNKTNESVNDNSSGTHDNDNKGDTQDTAKEPHETAEEKGSTDKKRKLIPDNVQQLPVTRSRKSSSGT